MAPPRGSSGTAVPRRRKGTPGYSSSRPVPLRGGLRPALTTPTPDEIRLLTRNSSRAARQSQTGLFWISEPTMPTPSSDRAKRVLQARMAAHALHARVPDPAAHTAPAREIFLSRFEREVDPDGLLEPQERARRAEHAKKAYFLKLAAASSTARSKKRRK